MTRIKYKLDNDIERYANAAPYENGTLYKIFTGVHKGKYISCEFVIKTSV